MAKKEILVKTVKDYLRASNEVTVENYYKKKLYLINLVFCFDILR